MTITAITIAEIARGAVRPLSRKNNVTLLDAWLAIGALAFAGGGRLLEDYPPLHPLSPSPAEQPLSFEDGDGALSDAMNDALEASGAHRKVAMISAPAFAFLGEGGPKAGLWQDFVLRLGDAVLGGVEIGWEKFWKDCAKSRPRSRPEKGPLRSAPLPDHTPLAPSTIRLILSQAAAPLGLDPTHPSRIPADLWIPMISSPGIFVGMIGAHVSRTELEGEDILLRLQGRALLMMAEGLRQGRARGFPSVNFHH